MTSIHRASLPFHPGFLNLRENILSGETISQHSATMTGIRIHGSARNDAPSWTMET
jgi:hypothetical protein